MDQESLVFNWPPSLETGNSKSNNIFHVDENLNTYKAR